MKKIISVICIIAMLGIFAIPGYAVTQEEATPVIIDTVYETDEIVIADIIATQAPYLADNTGVKDSTEAIQKAIDDCYNNGGGTVWLPEGKYKISGNLYVKKFVTLQGEYCDPDVSNAYGTVIIADVESTDAMTPALFNVGGSAGVVGLTVWYPEQTIDNVKPYPYTFYIEGNDEYMLQTIKNCTLINSYRGIGACSQCELGIQECHEMMTIENVKGTCLYEGLNAYNSADVDTIKTLYIDNKYWAEAGEEYNAPAIAKLNEYTKENGYGLVIGDLEWPEFADVKISDRLYGIKFNEGFRYTFSGSFLDTHITDCVYGIHITENAIFERGKTWGLAMANSTVEGSVYAIRHDGDSAVQLTNVEINGELEGSKVKRYNIDTSSYSPEYNKAHTLPNEVLYVVEADKTGKTDISVQLQLVLDEAGINGGIVYLPAGLYRLDNPIKIPARVELRGASSVATRCQRDCSNGTLIISYYGYSDGDEPLVTLDGNNAGISGIRIDYPENNPKDTTGSYKETSPAIYSEANDIYIVNCAVTLASKGVVLTNCENPFIKKLVGCCIEGMFDLTLCKNAFIEGCHQNGNTLPRNGYGAFGIPELENRIEEENIFEYFFIPVSRKTCTFITLSGCENTTVFNTFIYGAKSFLDSTDSSSVFVNIGHDGSSKTEYALSLSGGSTTFLNSMRSTEDGLLGCKYYTIENKGVFKSYNSQAVGMTYNEGIVLENVEEEEYLEGEENYGFFAFIFNLIRKLCEWFMTLQQG